MKENQIEESYGTLSETINELIKLGYTHDFNIEDDNLVAPGSAMVLSPDDFKIDQVFRFDSDSDPDYQSILYAISSVQYKVKGTLVNGYGISADDSISKLVEKLETNIEHNSLSDHSDDSGTTLPREAEPTLNGFTEMNLEEIISQSKNASAWATTDRNTTIIFRSETMRIVLIGLHGNAELKPHKTNGVISVQVLEGRLVFSTEEQSTEMVKGQMIALNANILHSVKAATECWFLLTIATMQTT